MSGSPDVKVPSLSPNNQSAIKESVMQIIEVQFPARRYHATPWDAHVNEGRVEWPPCPWRILRALIAIGYSKLGWTEEPSSIAVSLIEKMAGVTPQYVLPKSMQAHTRHYMPYTEGKNEKKTKVFDTFVKMTAADATMLIRYELELEQHEQKMLEQMVEGLAYLGRAESWVDARLLQEEEIGTHNERNWIAAVDSDSVNRTRLLSPMEAEPFLEWRNAETETAAAAAESEAEQFAIAKGKKLTAAQRKKVRIKAELPYPSDLVAALQQENSTWQKTGWPRPPGSRWIDYSLPDELFDQQPLAPTPVNRPFAKPNAILLAIDGEGKRGSLRPLMKRALPLMELLHSESVRYATQVLSLGNLPELTGKDTDGCRLNGAHSHAHWLPLSLSNNGKIDHVLVTATSGFSRGSVQAISRIRWAYSKGIRALSVNMVGQGDMHSIYQQLVALSQIHTNSIAILKPTDTFVSSTPMVLRKYLSRRGKKTLEGQVREELKERGYPDPVFVGCLSNQEMVKRKLKGHVLCRKSIKQQPPFERSWGVHIRFDQTIDRCPITLGYASHFGLGMFKATTERID